MTTRRANRRVVVSGDDADFDDQAATPVALLFHELATNAAKYGALSVPDGRVALTTLQQGDRYVMTWRERGGPPLNGTPKGAGFGSSLLALATRGDVELALVDIHLSDGATGVGLGQELGEEFGVTVLYMTANPGMVSHGVPGTMGVLTKPTDEAAVRDAVEYALHLRRGEPAPVVPPGLQMFG